MLVREQLATWSRHPPQRARNMRYGSDEGSFARLKGLGPVFSTTFTNGCSTRTSRNRRESPATSGGAESLAHGGLIASRGSAKSGIPGLVSGDRTGLLWAASQPGQRAHPMVPRAYRQCQ